MPREKKPVHMPVQRWDVCAPGKTFLRDLQTEEMVMR